MKSIVNKFLGSSYLLEPITLGGAALVAGGTALANWLFNKEQNSSNVGKSKELMDYQVNKQQQYQRWLSAMQYPSMIASLRSAGLNPNLALGGTPSQMQASQPSAITGISPTRVNPLYAAQAFKELELLDTQRENIEADTKNKQADTSKKFAETDLLDNQNVTFFETWAKDLAEKDSRIGLNDSQKAVNQEQLKYLAKAEDELLSKIDLNKSFLAYNEKQINNYDNIIRATINEKLAHANFLNAEAKSELSLLMYKQFNYSAMTRMYNTQSGVNETQQGVNRAQTGLLEVNKLGQEITNKYANRYGDAQHIIGMVTDVVKTAASCTSAGGMLLMGLNNSKSSFGTSSESWIPSPYGKGMFDKVTTYSNHKK